MLAASNHKIISAHHLRGFTLIELMITVAIIGILAGIALFAYQDYTIKAQVSEGLVLVTKPEIALTEWQSANPGFPNSGNPGNNALLGLPVPASISGNFVSSVAVVNGGGIELTYGNKANSAIAGASHKCLLTPVTSAPGAIRWQAACGFDSRYLPRDWRP